MSDLISRSALIEHIKDVPTWIAYDKNPRKYPVGMYDPEDVIGSIENAPTIELYGTWIPCSERLPLPNNAVLVCTNTGKVDVDYYGAYLKDFIGLKGTSMKPTAWMPLPEPYKEDE